MESLMPNLVTEENVDLYKMPTVDETTSNEGEVTIGDLHGNAMKLVFLLVKHGIVSEINETDYASLVNIYQKSPEDLTQIDLISFNDILGKMKFNNKIGIRFLGDELADRGSNDYFTLKLLEQLHKNNVSFEILVSNHGIEFIEAYETKRQGRWTTRFECRYEQAMSLDNLEFLCSYNLVKKQEILQLVETVYKPYLKALSYSFNDDLSEMTIYSHAPIGLNTIKALKNQFGIVEDDLESAIYFINKKFQELVLNNKVNTLYKKGDNGDIEKGYANKKSDNPFVCLLLNRECETLQRDETLGERQLNWVHGHHHDFVNRTGRDGHVFNLDNLLGKRSKHIDQYTVLHSSSNQISNQEIVRFKLLLDKINKKAIELEGKHPKAFDKAQAFYTTMTTALEALSKDGNFDVFQERYVDADQAARPELEKHRGLKQILGNLGLAVLGLGVFYAAATLVNYAANGRFLFFTTDSVDKMDKLKEQIESLKSDNKNTI